MKWCFGKHFVNHNKTWDHNPLNNKEISSLYIDTSNFACIAGFQMGDKLVKVTRNKPYNYF